jgi:uncharacterized protein (DUF305 family)
MNFRIVLLATAVAIASLGAAAQQSGGSSSSMQMPPPFETPAECKTAGGGQMMQGANMPEGMMQHMQGMMGNMDEAHKAYMQSMMKMQPPMMQGLMAKDADVAFFCMMIPHHMGAIENARIVLKHGDNAEAKKMAEKTMKEQEKEIAEMKEWLQKHAKKEGN